MKLYETGRTNKIREISVEGLCEGKGLALPEQYFIALDTETTGVSDDARAVQLSMIFFSVCHKRIIVLGAKSLWNDPGIPMTAEAAAYTGITPDLYAGKKFPEDTLQLLQGASLIIAHNAAFDRRILTKEYPSISETVWGCTQSDIDWRKLKIASKALEFIVYKYGYCYDAHEALADTLAVLCVLKNDDNFSKILEKSTRSSSLVVLPTSTYTIKDQLRQLGFTFNYEKKHWSCVCNDDDDVHDVLDTVNELSERARSYAKVLKYAPKDRFA